MCVGIEFQVNPVELNPRRLYQHLLHNTERSPMWSAKSHRSSPYLSSLPFNTPLAATRCWAAAYRTESGEQCCLQGQLSWVPLMFFRGSTAGIHPCRVLGGCSEESITRPDNAQEASPPRF